MTEIRRIGAYLEIDADGFLRRNASSDVIRGKWREMVGAATDACVERWGDDLHSVYVGGSVASGQAIAGVSDVDLILAMRRDRLNAKAASDWSRSAASALEARFPKTEGLELVCFAEESVLTRGTPESVVVAIECACVYGENLASRIPQYGPGPDIALQMRHFGGGLEVFRDEYPEETEEEKKATMAWLMRRFLRAGMELVMVEERRFTRDLYLCYESFAKHYPAREREMYRTLELAINPVPDEANERFIREFGEWLREGSEEKLMEWEAEA